MEEKQKIHFRLFKLLIWVLVITWIIFYNNYSNFLEEEIIDNSNNKISIIKWDTFYSLWKKLNIDEFYLKIYLRYNKPNYTLQKWNYEINLWSNIKWIIDWLKKPIIKEDKITILEWWSIYDIDDLLYKRDLIDKSEFIKNAKKYEWMLYPDTYNINENNFNINDFINKLLDNFKNKVIAKLPLEISNNKENLEKLLILSSIVEKEANIKDNPEEIAIIAWILKKRLEENWFIWADITVCYPYELTSKECNPDFIWRHINDKNEYNTRTMLWLPKTPIWNPSYKTINATLNYKNSEYYFYLHDNNWKIHYSETNEWHVNNKNLYLK